MLNVYRAIVAGAVFCRFSGCHELAFGESRWGPLCEDHIRNLMED